MNHFIDTHCHLDAAEFGHTQPALVQAARAAGVTTLVIPAVERANFASVQQLCATQPACAPAYGIHPMYVQRAAPADLDVLREYLQQPNVVAVGEIGLDFFVEGYDQQRQEFYFAEQLKLAREFDLPVLLHIRRAQDTILKHLRQIRVRGGIAHAFNGSPQQAAEFIKLGFKLGFGGAMTYSRASKLRELARTLPLDSLVLETDAPDIPPDFLARGEPNKPEYLPRIAQTLAALRGLPLEEIALITTTNARSVLPKLG
ncbi:MAG TPA: TatD family hydrolase [Gallionellaceae bacterium]|nr:TatD family hydrolase [Gallionellaceae bacterium]